MVTRARKPVTTNAGTEEIQTLLFGDVKWYSQCGNQCGDFSQNKRYTIIKSGYTTLGHTPEVFVINISPRFLLVNIYW